MGLGWNLTKLFLLVFICQPFRRIPVSFISGGPYGPRGVLTDFEGGSQKCIIGQTPRITQRKVILECIVRESLILVWFLGENFSKPRRDL